VEGIEISYYDYVPFPLPSPSTVSNEPAIIYNRDGKPILEIK
jgi:hypothetical protein